MQSVPLNPAGCRSQRNDFITFFSTSTDMDYSRRVKVKIQVGVPLRYYVSTVNKSSHPWELPGMSERESINSYNMISLVLYLRWGVREKASFAKQILETSKSIRETTLVILWLDSRAPDARAEGSIPG